METVNAALLSVTVMEEQGWRKLLLIKDFEYVLERN